MLRHRVLPSYEATAEGWDEANSTENDAIRQRLSTRSRSRTDPGFPLLGPEEIRHRFMYALKELTPEMAQRLTLQLQALKREFDAVIVEYAVNSRALDAFPATTRKLLDTHD
ncbi:hypothetical protein IB230_19620, partial [Pseudoxanthomonas sp. PXM01]|nr:hypothetical protein [Pseudoxanthomonas sp. PXM01]